MTVKVDVETVDPVRRRIAVEIPAETVQSELDKAYVGLSRNARVPGFRRGRAPRSVLERMFGDSVRAEVFTKLIQESFSSAVEEHHIHPLGAPEIVTDKAEPGAGLRYSAMVEVRPDIADVHYAGLEVERPTLAVSEADIDTYVGRLRQSLAQLHPIEDRDVAQAGDVVNLDYQARIAGRLVSKGDGRDVEIGANQFPPEFDNHLTGARVGQELKFSVTYPETAPPEVANKTVEFGVTPHRLSRKELPALDDDFAKDHGECDTMDELRARVRTQLEAEVARSADEAMRRNLLTELAKANEVPIPEVLVRRRTEALVDEVREEWRRQRILPKAESEAVARLHVDLEPRAREQVKLGILLDAVARTENVGVGEDELDRRIDEIAHDAGTAGERVRALYQNHNARHQLHARMLQSRTIDAIAAKANVKNVDAGSRVADTAENG